jgi:uncharacterized protein YndB with AHSA1/START domain
VARSTVFIEAPPDRVFAVLADPPGYADWVVGSREVRNADESWPSPGTHFDHTVGWPPFLLISDETVVLDSDPPVRLILEAKARPLPSARITFELEPRGRGTQVLMTEDLAQPLLNALAGPILHGLIRVRNARTLRRLKALAERRVT